MNCTGTIEVTCNKCGIKQLIQGNDFTYWDEVSEDNGAAGKEVQSESIIEHICSVCNNKIEIKASVWTYPDAPAHKPNCFDIDSVSGAEFVKHNCKITN